MEQADMVLTTIEATDLAQHEATIDRGLKTFYEVGNALVAIRDGRLYRGQFDTFEDYCQGRWGIARNYANKMIAAAGIIRNLGTIVPTDASPIVGILPVNEAQTRPLALLEPEQQREAWQRAVESAPNGKVTGAHVARVVEDMRSPLPFEPVTPDDFGEVDAEPLTPYEAQIAASYVAPPLPTPPPATHQLLTSSESNEWYTPAEYVDAARAVMGGIDLDPASNALANRTIQAARFYALADDGYAQPWGTVQHPARIWLNPPYGKEGGESNAARWVRRLLAVYELGHVAEAVLLVNASTGDGWFAPLKQFPICFPDNRIRFYNVNGEASQPTHSNALIYLGPNVARFVEVFSRFGSVMARLSAYDGHVFVEGVDR